MATCLPNLSRLFHRPRPAAPSSASSAQATAAYRPRIETFTYATAATSSGGGVEGGGKDGMKLRVDAYLPQQQPQKQQPGWPPPPPRPAVLFFHPGELLFGARADVLRALCGLSFPPIPSQPARQPAYPPGTSLRLPLIPKLPSPATAQPLRGHHPQPHTAAPLHCHTPHPSHAPIATHPSHAPLLATHPSHAPPTPGQPPTPATGTRHSQPHTP